MPARIFETLMSPSLAGSLESPVVLSSTMSDEIPGYSAIVLASVLLTDLQFCFVVFVTREFVTLVVVFSFEWFSSDKEVLAMSNAVFIGVAMLVEAADDKDAELAILSLRKFDSTTTYKIS